MTCIVGVAADGKVHLGGDSAGVSGWDMQIRAEPKVFKTGPFLMGFTTSFRMGQLLHYRLEVAERTVSQSVEEYMVVTFVDAVRACLTDGGWKKVENNRDEGGNFLVGYDGHLFEIFSDFQVAEYADGLAACGCGEQFAIGALEATVGFPPRQRVLKALRVAERRSAGVSGPFTVLAQ